ncbi:hypothetical protein MUP79_04155, partial [Candidatus Bathyarchaeota archaeon]|nr:hypothetical protein [Candidatus Bathyarchaeota archaeon]
MIRDLVTLLILNYAQATQPQLGIPLDIAKSWIQNDINNLGGEACYSPIHAGGWFKVEGDVTAKLQAVSPLITIASQAIDTLQFGFDANKLVTAKLIPIGGGVEGSVELSSELEIYADEIGISFNLHAEGYLGFDLGFASFTGQNKGFDFTNELKFDKSTLNLESIVCTYEQEVTTEMFENSQFGGLLKTVNLANLILQPSKTYKITTTVEIPATNAGKLHDLLTASNLLKLSASQSMIDKYDLMQAVAETLMNGEKAEYSVTIEQKDAKSFSIELSGLPMLGEVCFSFDFKYVQSQSFLKECGHVTSANGEFVAWPAFKYAETPPQSIDAQNFILNNLIDWNPLTGPQGTVVQMQEVQSKLYLHVHDMDGNHVGFNFAQNTTDLNIPGSAYYDDLNGRTDIVLPSDLNRFTITVDGTQAHEAQESFLLALCRFGAPSTAYAFVNDTIEKGQTLNYNVYIGPSGVPIVDNTPPTTGIVFGQPSIKVAEWVFLTGSTPVSFTATDNQGGSGVSLTTYRVYNTNFDSGWTIYNGAFNLSSYTDGNFTIAYNSTDNAGNIEKTNTVQVTLFSWNHVFKDSDGRGTVLKVNTVYKFFQFTAPTKDFGVKYDAKMVQLCKQVIIICYEDRDMRL